MNKVVLIGRLTKDPELKTGGSNNTSYSRFTIAVNRKYKNSDGKYDADFIGCIAFGKTAETISKFFNKGRLIAVSGHIQTGNYKDKDGKTVYTTDIMIDDFDFVESKGGGNGNTSAQASDSGSAKNPADDDFMQIPDGISEELPFA